MANSVSLQNDPSYRRQRIGHLAVLPVFFNVRGKPALVIGGGEPAAWKAELLAQAGARVNVVGEDICHEMAALAQSEGLQGSIHVEARAWSISDFARQSLIIADAATEGEARAVHCAARAAGIPVNIIDRPEFCTFQFGSIVNRSPVVIGISTDGAAPVVGQSIRTKIENLLPDSLSQWATFAKEIRSVVLNRFKPGFDRRHFWTNFSYLAFGPFRPESVWDNCGATSAGSVNLAEVHPFDPDDLTLRSIRTLQTADVIYFDSRISPKIIELARREAIRVAVKNWSGRISDLRHKSEISEHVRNGRLVALVGCAQLDRNTVHRTLPATIKADFLSLTNSASEPAQRRGLNAR